MFDHNPHLFLANQLLQLDPLDHHPLLTPLVPPCDFFFQPLDLLPPLSAQVLNSHPQLSLLLFLFKLKQGYLLEVGGAAR